MNLSTEHRETLGRWMPLVLAVLAGWLLWRALKRSFWTAFGLAWAFWWVPPQVYRAFARNLLAIF
jgi:hypothetical protein